jgi:hypothetical protein
VLWPGKNLALVVAINGGAANDAARAVFDGVRERAEDFEK